MAGTSPAAQASHSHTTSGLLLGCERKPRISPASSASRISPVHKCQVDKLLAGSWLQLHRLKQCLGAFATRRDTGEDVQIPRRRCDRERFPGWAKRTRMMQGTCAAEGNVHSMRLKGFYSNMSPVVAPVKPLSRLLELWRTSHRSGGVVLASVRTY